MKKRFLVIVLFCFILLGCGSNDKSGNDEVHNETLEEIMKSGITEIDDLSINLMEIAIKVEEDTFKLAKENNDKITIVIDPGHSSNPSKGTEPNAPGSSIMKAKDVSGATGLTGIQEYKITHKISNLLKRELENRGFTVIMTKTEESQSVSNIERAEIGNNAGASLVIRIHADSFSDSSAAGASVLVPPKESKYTSSIADLSYTYGSKILDSYLSKVPVRGRGVIVRNDMTGFNWSKVPVVILEMGFLSNPNDNVFLSNEANYSAIIEGISYGISNCF